MIHPYSVLSIDAWAEDDSWNWNSWYNVGTIVIDINDSHENILQAMVDAGCITQTEGGAIVDDGYNLVIVDVENNYMPIFAIEYGSAEHESAT